MAQTLIFNQMKSFLLYFSFAFSITISSAQSSVSVLLPTDQNLCAGGNLINLQPFVSGGTLPYTFSWWANVPANLDGGLISNAPTQILSPLVDACYFLQVADSQGTTSNIDTFCLHLLPRPIADAGPDIVRCINDSSCVNLQASISPNNLAPAPFSFLWTPTLGIMSGHDTLLNPCVNPSFSINYTLNVTAANGCTNLNQSLDTLSNVQVTVFNSPTISFPILPNDTIALGDSVSFPCNWDLSNSLVNATFSWDVGNGIPSNTCPYVLHPTQTTTYKGFIMTNGCIDTVFYTIYILPLSIDNEEDKLHFLFSPNPSDGHFSVKFEGGSGASLRIFEVGGKMVFSEKILQNGKEKSDFDVSFLPKGIYFLNIDTNQQESWQKLILY